MTAYQALESEAAERRQSHALLPRATSPLRRPFDAVSRRWFALGYWRELRELLYLSLPAFLTCFFQIFLQTISVIMCGHLSKDELDAVALACTLINVAGLGIGLGLSSGCDTYFAQTYGSNNKKRVGLYLQRSLIVMYMFLVPVYCLHLNIKPLLLLLGQDPRISAMTAKYILIFMPGVFFDYTFLVLARYLQTQNRVNPPLFCAFLGNVFNAVTQYVAIFVIGFGYEASAACQAASLFVMCALMVAYILLSGVYEETWDGWTSEAWRDIGSFVRLAVPGLLLVALEELSFEVGTFVAGTISSVELAAQGIVFQTATLSYMVSLGMSIAVNIRVGQNLGAQRPEHARHTYRVALTMIFCTSTALCLMFSLGNNFIAGLFTNDPVVREYTAKVMQVYAPFPFVDGLSATGSGVLKGCGKQLIGAVVNIFAYDAVGLPLGIPLALLTDLRVRGVWLGLLVGLSFETFIFWVIILRTDLAAEASKALERATGEKPATALAEDDETSPLIGRKPRRQPSRIFATPYDSDCDVAAVERRNAEAPQPRVLLRRVVTCGCLAVALAGAVVLRLLQDASEAERFNGTTNATSF